VCNDGKADPHIVKNRSRKRVSRHMVGFKLLRFDISHVMLQTDLDVGDGEDASFQPWVGDFIFF
jgi:hypothetical protein